jgi:hypothetical protein
LAVFQRVGVNLGPAAEGYDPEPDVVIIDRDVARNPEERCVGRFDLAAEVVSASDRKWSEKKRDIYKLHESCTCILTVQQDQVEVCADLRTSSGWTDIKLKDLDGLLVLADFGLECKVSELHRGTLLEA